MHHRIGGLLILAGSAGFGLLLILGLTGAAIGTADNPVTGVILLGTAACAVVVVISVSDLMFHGGDFALALRFAGLGGILLGWAGFGFVAARAPGSS